MKIILLLNLCLFFLASNIFAAPVVTSTSGDVENGENVTISGSGFGIKVNASPLVFENFDSNDEGRQDDDTLRGRDCSHFGSWRDQTWDHAPTYEIDNNRTGSTQCGYYPLVADDTAQNHSNAWIDFTDTHQSTLLISLWIRFTFESYDGSVGNVKMYRITDGEGDSDDHTVLQAGAGNNAPTRGAFGQWAGTNFKHWPIEGDNTLNFTYKNDGVWSNHIIMLKASDSDTPNGSAIIWVDGVKLEDTSVMETWGTGDSWKSFTIGHYVANYKAGKFHIYADDIYIDNTWQSVWIGDKPVWDNCTHREIQIPASWSETNIEFEFNQASFDEGDNVYLFVVDENGNTSNGYPITIGGDNSLTFDVNDDGQVNVLDVIMCVNIVLDNDTGNADVNGDGETNVQDVIAVVNEILDN